MIDLSGTYFDPNIIYHYTSLETFVNFILPKKQLRFKKRIEQDDYFERKYLNPVWHWENGQVDPNSLDGVEDKTRNRFQNIFQISFCKSGFYDSDKWKKNTVYDGYGFLKHRMWDTYGRKNKGVCLALDRQKIEENLSELNVKATWFRDVEYKKNEEIERVLKPRSSQKLTDPDIEDAFQDHLLNNLFLKNIDFRDENECRAVIETSSFKDIFLKIDRALISVFISGMRKIFPISDKVMFDHIVNESKEREFKVYALNPFDGQILIDEAD